MTRPAFLLALPLGLALLLGAAGCARTALAPPCPLGMAQDQTSNRCLCVTDEGCPTGHDCDNGVCTCRDTACCPTGYEYQEAADACVCRAEECCPKDHLWLPEQTKCACGAQECCPDGYTFDPLQGACACAADACCPTGFIFDPAQEVCACASDGCCPVDFRFDELRRDCVCAKDACCPPEHKYHFGVQACVCIGDSCCPEGFKKDPQGERCICTQQACSALNPNLVCDAASGACRCQSDLGCKSGQFCNPFGFCQSISACTSNSDCPTGYFCDVSLDTCIPQGPCTLDEHCPFGRICDRNSAACVNGCRKDADCIQKQACVGGVCLAFCRQNDSCPASQFCENTSGSCSFRSGRHDCRSCGPTNPCPTVNGQTLPCLAFVGEGQNEGRFCGMPCQGEQDCPSGYDCTGIIHVCQEGPFGSGCGLTASGEQTTCKDFLVENEDPELKRFCADATGLPHVFARSCAPSSGFCPATAAP